MGAPKSGTELNARAILKAAGLSYSDFAKVEYLPFGESVELMKNRQLDATLQSAGLGVSSLRDLATSIKMVVVPIPQDVVLKVGDPAYQSGVVPANTYEGQTTNVPTAYVQNFLITRADLPTDTVYTMTKSLFEQPRPAQGRAFRRQVDPQGSCCFRHAAAAAPGRRKVLS